MTAFFRNLLILLVALTLLRCGNMSISKQIYTDKDVEGYWVTSNLLNHGNAQQLGFKDEKGVNDFLRLKNSVNGHSDSTYYVKGESLYVLSNHPQRDSAEVIKREFAAKYQIRFVSKERLVLFDYELQKELTYYSVMTAPEKSKGFTQMGFDDILITHDSVFYRQSASLDVIDGPPMHWNERVKPADVTWINTLDSLAKRLIVQSLPIQQRKGNTVVPPRTFWIQSGGKLAVVNNSFETMDPVMRTIYMELDAFRQWSRNHPPKERARHIYPSQWNSWLTDSAAVAREKQFLSR